MRETPSIHQRSATLVGRSCCSAHAFREVVHDMKTTIPLVAKGGSSEGNCGGAAESRPSAAVPPGLTKVMAVAADGFLHGLAVRDDAGGVAWGDNDFGQPEVPAALHNGVALAAGAGHPVARQAAGRVLAWGYNAEGETVLPASVILEIQRP